MTILADAARLYAVTYSWPILPLRPRGKDPLTEHGVKDASADPAQVAAQWQRWPDANIGLHCGGAGLLALDFDVNKREFAGQDLLQELVTDYPTLMSETGSGGRHLLYRLPQGVTLGDSRGALPKGIDVKTLGYIVLPPSIHPNGNRYQFAQGYGPHEIQPAVLPDLVLKQITAGAVRDTKPLRPSHVAPLPDDHELLKLIRDSRQGAEFDRLWSGDTEMQHGDHSAADAALLRILAFWTQHDRAAMDRLFRQSGLMRPKWEREDYREHSLDHAIKQTPNKYQPPQERDQAAIDAAQAAVGAGGNSHRGQAVSTSYAQGAGLNGSGPAAPQQPPTVPYASAKPRFPEFMVALDALGYGFSMSELNDAIFVNDEPMTPTLAAEIRVRMRDYGYSRREWLDDAITYGASLNRFHPIKRYLQDTTWDGVDYLRAIGGCLVDAHPPIKYQSGHSEAVAYAFFKRWMIGAIAKVCEPVTRNAQNPMFVMDSLQGKGKSYFVRWLCSGLPEFFIESAINPAADDNGLFLISKWVWEVAELGATMRAADREGLKAFITRAEVTFRPKYERQEITRRALASFIGTINSEAEGFLIDPTGNRRFNCVRLNDIHRDYTIFDVNQVWAQAYHLYTAGEPWELLPEEVQMRDEINASYEAEDVAEGWLLRYFDIDPAEKGWWMPTQMIVDYLQTMGMRESTRAIQMQVGRTLTRRGLKKERRDTKGNVDPKGARCYIGIRQKPNGITP